MISLLLPSRQRLELCVKSIRSLTDKARDGSCFEVLIACDYDDETLYESIHDGAMIKVFRYDRRKYVRLHEYYNDLGAKANGEWLFVWNDDCTMLSEGWDETIQKFNGTFMALAPIPLNRNGKKRRYRALARLKTLFPIVPKNWLEVVGRISGHSATDTWVEYVAQAAGCYAQIDLDIKTDRPSDKVALHGKIPIDFHDPIMVEERQKDIDKLRELL
jgi:hypothetical protein